MTTSLTVRTRPAPLHLPPIRGVPLVRLRPAPRTEPPYEGEDPLAGALHRLTPAADRWTGQGGAACPEDPPAGLDDPAGGPDPAGRPGGPTAGGPDPAGGPGGATATRPHGADGSAAVAGPSREARRAVRCYLSVCLEVLDGFRPMSQLRRLTAPAGFDAVAAQLARPTARAGHPPVTAQGRHGARISTGRIRVHRVLISAPRADAIEVVAVLGRGGRSWALAFRLEHAAQVAGTAATWTCTALEVV